jgi:predicted O-linked N-acetylglucosamine transferase (SPINDLY family)
MSDKKARAEAESVYQQAHALHVHGRLDHAGVLYQHALRLHPQHGGALHQLGMIALQNGQADVAAGLLDKAIRLNPRNAASRLSQGDALYSLSRFEAAIASYDRAIALEPRTAAAYNNRGVALRSLNRHAAALASCDYAIALAPEFPDAHYNRGTVLADLKQFEAAIASYDRALALKPDFVAAYYGRGAALADQKNYEAALVSYNLAIALAPGYADAYNNRGIALAALMNYEAALLSYNQAVLLRPSFADAYNNRGVALAALKRHDEALASYNKAIAQNNGHAGAHNNRGNLLRELQQYEAAISSYDQAFALKPDIALLAGMRLYTKLRICDWRRLDEELARLVARIERGEAAASPLCIAPLSESAALQRRVAELWARQNPSAPALAATPPREGEKICVGYFSADFRDHAVSVLTAQLFELHDRNKFEITAFSYGPDTQDEMRKRMEKAFDRFIDVRGESDQRIAALARTMQIDIAVDLGGYTQDGRPGIFAARSAPLQVSYLGYAGTLAADFMDYLIADAVLVPESSRAHYSEQIIYMPDSYMVNDAQRSIADKVFTREELGLPHTGFVFCCFNNSYKITPGTFEAWMRILSRLEDSVLWLSEGHPMAAENLRREAARRGVNPQRLIFAKRMASLPEHLARHRAADLFLDTLPYNAHTTAADALWAGLPVLTCVGEAFAGRVAASLLKAIRLPELITTTRQEYEEFAVELATQPRRLAAIRQKLEDNRLTTPLFVNHLEAAYTKIYQRCQAGLPAAPVYPESD